MATVTTGMTLRNVPDQVENICRHSRCMLTVVQPCICAALRAFSALAHVVELALGVVMHHQQPQRLAAMGRWEGEHLQVAIGVAGRQDRAAAGHAPDPERPCPGRR